MSINTIGSDLLVAAGTAGLTPPTTGWKSGWGGAIVDFPDMSSWVNTIDVTPILETNSARYVKGLADSGGAADIELNVGPAEAALKSAVRDLAATSDGVLWFMLVYPRLDEEGWAFKKEGWAFKAELGTEYTKDEKTEIIPIIPNYIVEGMIDVPTGSAVTPLV